MLNKADDLLDAARGAGKAGEALDAARGAGKFDEAMDTARGMGYNQLDELAGSAALARHADDLGDYGKAGKMAGKLDTWAKRADDVGDYGKVGKVKGEKINHPVTIEDVFGPQENWPRGGGDGRGHGTLLPREVWYGHPSLVGAQSGSPFQVLVS